jgi:hypothetical protein
VIVDSEYDCDLVAEHVDAVHVIVCRVCGRQLGGGRADIAWQMWLLMEERDLRHEQHRVSE